MGTRGDDESDDKKCKKVAKTENDNKSETVLGARQARAKAETGAEGYQQVSTDMDVETHSQHDDRGDEGVSSGCQFLLTFSDKTRSVS